MLTLAVALPGANTGVYLVIISVESIVEHTVITLLNAPELLLHLRRVRQGISLGTNEQTSSIEIGRMTRDGTRENTRAEVWDEGWKKNTS